MKDLYLLGILAIMMSPMVFGAITMVYSLDVTKDVGKVEEE